MGEGENFSSREKKFSPSPKPPSLFKKSGVFCRSACPAENISSARIPKVLLHEVAGHLGLRKLFSGEFDRFLFSIAQTHSDEVAKIAADRNLDISNEAGLLEAAEEFVATFAENGTENTIWQRIAAAFRNFLRNIGFDLEYSDSELRSLLSRGLRDLQGSVVKDNLTTDGGVRYLAVDEQGQYFPAPDEWGTAYTSMTGKGLQAIEFLLEKKNGFVPAAFHRPEIGDIDIVYGKTGYGIEDKGGYGLAHISKRHPDIIWSKIVDTIDNGKFEPERKGKRLIVSQDGKIILRINQKGRNWVISALSIASTEELSAVNRAKGLPANLNPKGLYTIGDVLDNFKSPDEKNPENASSTDKNEQKRTKTDKKARHSVANDGGFRSSDPHKEELWAKFIVKIANAHYINTDAAAALLLDHGIRITPRDEQTLVAACVIARRCRTWQQSGVIKLFNHPVLIPQLAERRWIIAA